MPGAQALATTRAQPGWCSTSSATNATSTSSAAPSSRTRRRRNAPPTTPDVPAARRDSRSRSRSVSAAVAAMDPATLTGVRSRGQWGRHTTAGTVSPRMPTILITGATDGLGRAVARDLAEQGWTVLVHGRSRAKAEAVAAETGGRAYVADLASLAEVRRLADE